MTELETIIDVLEDDLEWLSQQNNPNDNLQYKNVRVMLTLAQEVQALKLAQESRNETVKYS